MRRSLGRALLAAVVGLGLAPARPAVALTVAEGRSAQGLGYYGLTQGRIPVFDANGDGLRDVLLNGHNQQRWWLMLGRKDGTFAPSDAVPFKKGDLHGCVAADFASPAGGPDGRVDLFCTVGANQGRGGRPFYKHLFVQGPSGTFTDLAAARGLGMPLDRGRDAVAANIDGDVLPDLLTAALGSPAGGSFNRAFVNRGGSFQELSPAKFPVRGETGSECMAALPTTDRFDDVVYCVKPGPKNPHGLAHFKNSGGAFAKVVKGEYLKLAARKVAFADVSGDLKPDLIVLTGGELSVWFNDGGDAFPVKDVSVPVTQAFAFAACRIDDDADVDLFVAQGKHPGGKAAQAQDFALLNNGTGRQFARLAVSPRQEPGNADWVTCLPDWQGTGFAMVYVTNGRWLLPGHNRTHVFRR